MCKDYFKILMTLHTIVTRRKHDSEEAQNCSFITDPDNNSSKLGSALDVKIQQFQTPLFTSKLYKQHSSVCQNPYSENVIMDEES